VATGSSLRPHPAKVAIVAFILAAHALLLISIEVAMRWRPPEPEATQPAFMLWMPEAAAVIESAPPALPRHGQARRSAPVQAARLPAPSPLPPTSQDHTVTVPIQPSPPVDWNAERSRVAELSNARLFAQPQRGSSFTPEHKPGDIRLADPRQAKPGIAWTHARTEFSGAIPIFWLNDNCILIAFLMPTCAIGKIRARGDLFAPMKVQQDLEDSQPAVP
jgi:hypothetical protein